MDYAVDATANAEAGVRARFVMRTYAHLLGAIGLFVLLEYLMFTTEAGLGVLGSILGLPWYAILGGFILVGWMARSVAFGVSSPSLQYLALVAFVAAEALIFAPLLAFIAFQMEAPGLIQSAAGVTIFGFLALTAVVWYMRADFQFLRGALMFGGLMAIGTIIAALVFGFQLGTWFSCGMIVLAGFSILYDTSKVMLRYPADRHVSAALELFASVALLFWYVLQLMMSLQRD